MKKSVNKMQTVTTSASLRGDAEMDYTEHLEEMRRRIILVLSFITILFCGGVFIRSHILNFLLTPLQEYGPEIQLKYDYMGESIMVQLKASFLTSIGLTIPLALQQTWAYVKPAVERKQRMFIRVLLFFAVILFYAGIFFCYRYVAPMTLRIIEQFAHNDIPNNINVTNYLHFLVTLVVIFGVIFELPIVITFLTKLGIITPRLLRKQRKYAVVLVWIAAALITPPDILTQMMIAIPLMVLFEFSILLSYLVYRKSKD